jgi:hypothetical protein
MRSLILDYQISIIPLGSCSPLHSKVFPQMNKWEREGNWMNRRSINTPTKKHNRWGQLPFSAHASNRTQGGSEPSPPGPTLTRAAVPALCQTEPLGGVQTQPWSEATIRVFLPTGHPKPPASGSGLSVRFTGNRSVTGRI